MDLPTLLKLLIMSPKSQEQIATHGERFAITVTNSLEVLMTSSVKMNIILQSPDAGEVLMQDKALSI
jgi:hypothetical protein